MCRQIINQTLVILYVGMLPSFVYGWQGQSYVVTGHLSARSHMAVFFFLRMLSVPYEAGFFYVSCLFTEFIQPKRNFVWYFFFTATAAAFFSIPRNYSKALESIASHTIYSHFFSIWHNKPSSLIVPNWSGHNGAGGRSCIWSFFSFSGLRFSA